MSKIKGTKIAPLLPSGRHCWPAFTLISAFNRLFVNSNNTELLVVHQRDQSAICRLVGKITSLTKGNQTIIMLNVICADVLPEDFLELPTHPSRHLSIQPTIHPASHPSVRSSSHPPTHPSLHLSIRPPVSLAPVHPCLRGDQTEQKHQNKSSPAGFLNIMKFRNFTAMLPSVHITLVLQSDTTRIMGANKFG